MPKSARIPAFAAIIAIAFTAITPLTATAINGPGVSPAGQTKTIPARTAQRAQLTDSTDDCTTDPSSEQCSDPDGFGWD